MQHDELLRQFRALFGGAPRLYRAPGRVNLIGEHTDYNAGLVMPAAIQFETLVAAAPRTDQRLRVRSLNFDATVEFDLPVHGREAAASRDTTHWSDYVAGVAWSLAHDGVVCSGADLLIHSSVPIGSGLSSSAALEVAVGYALHELAAPEGTHPIDRQRLALLCQRAENDYVGMRCGAMDQLASACGRAGYALMLDCRSLVATAVSVGAAALVVCNTMVKHSHAGGEYNQRREQCESAVRTLAARWPEVTALRDVQPHQLGEAESLLDPLQYQRVRHVVTENARVLAMRDALAAGQLHAAGKLMQRSHASLRDDYAVSCSELDLMVQLGMQNDGVYGARMTGGGFGGCTINLVAPDAVTTVTDRIAVDYLKATGLQPEIYVCAPADGVSRIEL
jgi:galactokinase